MANRYVYSGAGGAGTGADWANAHTTLAAAITAGAAGDVYYVAHNHAESTAGALTLTFKGTSASPDRVLCVDSAGSVPPVAADLRTTASITNTGTNNMTINGYARFYGMKFNCGSGSSGSPVLNICNSNYYQLYESCEFNILATGTASRIVPASNTNGRVYLNNCTVSFGHTSQRCSNGGGWFRWTGDGAALITGATIPDTFLLSTAVGSAIFSGVDFTNLGAGTLCAADPLGNQDVKFINCALHASTVIHPGGMTLANKAPLDIIACHSSSTALRYERHMYQGALTTETTIVRTGGASTASVSYSYKIVADADNERDNPFETFEAGVWLEEDAPHMPAGWQYGDPLTVTVHIVSDNITFTDAEIWLEVEYLSSASYPIASWVSDGPATVLTAGANQATSSATWTTTGLGTPVKQMLEVTVTPQLAGLLRWKVKFAKTAGTVYICPKPELS